MTTMKKLFLSLLALATLISCKKEDNSECSKSDFVGTYVGVYKCDGSDPVSDYTYYVEERGSKYYIVDEDGQDYEMKISGCKFTVPETNIILASVSGDGSLSGTEITFNTKLSILTIPLNCGFTGVKN